MEILKEKILVIQTAFLGDAILTLPLVQKIKEINSNALITVLCIPSTKEVFENSASVNEVFVYDKRGIDSSIFSYLKLVYKIRSKSFSKVISPHRSVRSTLISYFSSAGKTVGFDIADFSFLYKTKIQYQKSKHEVERNLSLLGIDFSKNDWRVFPQLQLPVEAKNRIEVMLKIVDDKKIIAIAPGSVWKTKVYPAKYFIEIIRMILEANYFVVLIGGREDAKLCGDISKNFSSNIESFAGKLNVLESLSLLTNCKAVVCNDSAPTHLAMAAGIPALTIYCSTIPGFGFYPYNEKSKFVSYDDLPCKPCGIHGHQQCPIQTFDCAYKLKPEFVFEKLKQILSA